MSAKAIVILALSLLLLSFVAVPIHRVYAGTTYLKTSPDTVTEAQDASGTFPWTIQVQDITNLYGFDIQVTWDNTLITLSSVSYTDELNAIWPVVQGGWQLILDQSAAGSYRLVAVSTVTGSGFTTTGSQSLFTLTFNILKTFSNHDKSTNLQFSIYKLSDKDSNSIPSTPVDGLYTMTGGKPALSMLSSGIPTSGCFVLGSTFTVTLRMSEEYDVTGYMFEVYYPTALLNPVGFTDGPLGTPSVTVDELNGIITGNLGSFAPTSGPTDLLTITFQASYDHAWKSPSISGWQNVWTGTIFYHEATLSYQSGSDLQYSRGEITVGFDIAYKWNPIKGDVDLSGKVDITDLTSVANYYDSTESHYDPTYRTWSNIEQHFNLAAATGESTPIVDLFDLIVVASNFNASSP